MMQVVLCYGNRQLQPMLSHISGKKKRGNGRGSISYELGIEQSLANDYLIRLWILQGCVKPAQAVSKYVSFDNYIINYLC